MAINEKTSKRVASIAGKVLRLAKIYPPAWTLLGFGKNTVTLEEVLELAASCLTHTADKKRRKPRPAKGER